MRRKLEDYHDGAQDGLTPLLPLDLNSIEDFDQLLRAMARTAFGGRSLGRRPRSWRPCYGTPTAPWWAPSPGP